MSNKGFTGSLIANGPTSTVGTTTYALIPCEGYEQIAFNIALPTTGSPAGYFTFTHGIDSSRLAACNITDSLLIGGLVSAEITYSSSTPNRITLAAPSAAAAISIGFWRPRPFFQVTYTRSSGGNATGLYIDYHLWKAG